MLATTCVANFEPNFAAARVASVFVALLATRCSSSSSSGTPTDVQDASVDDASTLGDADGSQVEGDASAGPRATGSLTVNGTITPPSGNSRPLSTAQAFAAPFNNFPEIPTTFTGGHFYNAIYGMASPVRRNGASMTVAVAFTLRSGDVQSVVTMQVPLEDGAAKGDGRTSSPERGLHVALMDASVKSPHNAGLLHRASYRSATGQTIFTISKADKVHYSLHIKIDPIQLVRERDAALNPCDALPLPASCPDNGETVTISGELQLDDLPAPPT